MGVNADGGAGSFFHRHLWDTVIILEERKLVHPRCPRCDMLFPWCALNRSHLATAQCSKGAERKRQRLAEEELQENAERSFQAYGGPLKTAALLSTRYGSCRRGATTGWRR